jgi:hypothetical protein
MQDIVFDKALTQEKLIREIERIVIDCGTDYIDAIVHYCQKNDIEVETVASIVKSSGKLKSRLQAEGEQLNFLPRSARFPI